MADDDPIPRHVPVETTGRSQGERLYGVEKDIDRVWERLRVGNQTHDEFRRRLDAIEEKIAVAVKEQIADLRTRMSKEFSAVEGKIDAVKPPTLSAGKVLLSAFGVIATIATIIWAASRYPERGEFEELRRQQGEMVTRQALADRELGQLRGTLDEQRRVIDRLGVRP